MASLDKNTSQMYSALRIGGSHSMDDAIKYVADAPKDYKEKVEEFKRLQGFEQGIWAMQPDYKQGEPIDSTRLLVAMQQLSKQSGDVYIVDELQRLRVLRGVLAQVNADISPQFLKSPPQRRPRNETDTSRRAFDTTESGQIWAVIVGIDHYDSKSTSNLSGACADASAMLNHLVADLQVPTTNITLLLSERKHKGKHGGYVKSGARKSTEYVGKRSVLSEGDLDDRDKPEDKEGDRGIGRDEDNGENEEYGENGDISEVGEAGEAGLDEHELDGEDTDNGSTASASPSMGDTSLPRHAGFDTGRSASHTSISSQWWQPSFRHGVPVRPPTRENIMNALYDLRDNTQIERGDHIIFYFAGHGARYPVQTNDYKGHPIHSLEALCPADRTEESSPAQVLDITDRELSILLQELYLAKGDSIIVIADCCHSGGITRSDAQANFKIRSTPSIRGITAKDLLAAASHPRKQSQSVADETHVRWSSSEYVLLAACQSEEKATEVYNRWDAQWHGRFTSQLLDVLEHEYPRNFPELIQAIRDRMPTAYNSGIPIQTPVHWGRVDKGHSFGPWFATNEKEINAGRRT